ncbi:MAG: glyceraldehyde-3-phosphate dehydrogenase [Flavobacteriales bacterium]|nr:glyceraldehyde-3-phosphate dehydrogenase [Flavobacteriales bacterium]
MTLDTIIQTNAKWIDKKRAAVDLLNAIGQLMYDQNVELVLFRSPLVDQGVPDLLNLHEYAKDIVNKPIDIGITSELAMKLTEMDLAPSKIDIGRLSNEWMTEGDKYPSKVDFLNDKLSNFIGRQSSHDIKPKDVVLYGFGRIGRLCARELIRMSGSGQQLRLRAIVLRKVDSAQITKRAALFRMDSVHGPFSGVVTEDHENHQWIINGQVVQLIEANSPEEIDYTKYGIEDALVIDNTGVYRDKEQLGRHLQAKGVSKALLTAPGKDMPNIVYGLNHKQFEIDDTDLWSAASCTTNAISPVLAVIDNAFGIDKGHIETVHAYTNDQNLLDNFHKKERRGRSAAINMVITETGAGKAVTKVMPHFENKLTANAVRVPTPNGSLAIMHLSLNTQVDKDAVNAALKKAALEGDLVNQIRYSIEPELVSNDIIGNICCSVFDSPATLVSNDGMNTTVYVWYDNEFGYTKQVLRLAKYISKVRRLIYY